MEDGVPILLVVGHPDDAVDPWQQLLDLGPVRRLDRVQVGQVEDGDAAESLVLVAKDVRRSQPAQKLIDLRACGARHPADRLVGRGPPRGRFTDAAAGERIEERGLADARAAHERHHREVGWEPEAAIGIDANVLRVRDVQPEATSRGHAFVETSETDRDAARRGRAADRPGEEAVLLGRPDSGPRTRGRGTHGHTVCGRALIGSGPRLGGCHTRLVSVPATSADEQARKGSSRR
jgi:hypothetical protein